VGLANYHKKRHFTRTPEPKGKVGPKSTPRLRFVIQKHDASRLHYDFRLEFDGVLKSWAVPKGPSLDPDRKSLAVQVEDHPIDYGDFEGVIPEGEYGGGTVLLWDTGTWEPLHDPASGFKSGRLHFVLHGEKLRGEWSLVQMHGKAGEDGKNWLLMKLDDEFASKSRSVLDEKANSVKTARSLEQIAGDRDSVWSGEAKEMGKIPGAVKAPLPKQLAPQLALLAETPPTGDQWLHEIKFDGYRFLAHIKKGDVRLITRNGKDWTDDFPSVVKALSGFKSDTAIIDGEMVVLDEQGRTDFQALQAMLKDKESADPAFFAFDLPFCDGFDLRETPLIERKKRLEEILQQSNLAPIVNYSEHVVGDGAAVVEKACGMALEGIVSKKIDSHYASRRDGSWLKSKCGLRQEFVVIGYTDAKGARSGFGSLLLGYHDAKERLVYAGRVGTGFDEAMLKGTMKGLQKIRQDEPPTDVAPPARERRAAHWIKPTLVAEVNFTGWTRDGVLRHPAFIGFRSDKPTSEIVREVPAKAEKVEKLIDKEPANSRPRSTKPGPIASTNRVTLTHPDKILYPDTGITKQDLANYYQAVQEWMLPHVVSRPLALVRCPNGVGSKCFFQRNWTESLAESLDKVNIGKGKEKEYHMGLHDLDGLHSIVQMGVLEIHTWGCRSDDVEHPDQLIFDLDPGPGVAWKQVIKAARDVRKILESLRLPTFVKTSGGKGLHVTVPIRPTIDWESAKSFCKTIAESLVEKSDLFVSNMRKDLRHGKVYIDYNRNGRSATAVAPYSTRARPGAAVAMPISWAELGRLKSADYFKLPNVSKYLDKRNSDPWADFERSRVDLHQVVGDNPPAA